MNLRHSVSFRVGEWLAEPSMDRLSRDSVTVAVEPKAMAVLVYLAAHPLSVVSTEELVQEVWHGRPLGDNPVYKCIEKLRKALGDDQHQPVYIETIPRKGYRLIAPVTPVGNAAITRPPGLFTELKRRNVISMAAAIGVMVVMLGWFVWDKFGTNSHQSLAPENTSIAVLPFADMSPAGDQEYFSDGIAEEIINLLAQIKALKVIARTSSFAFKDKAIGIPEIGRILGVTHVLEGSVRKAGEQVRVTVQLVAVKDGSHRWSHSYDRRLDNIFAIQSEIAGAVTEALKLNLVGGVDAAPAVHSATTLPAYELYLHARRLIQSRTTGNLAAARGLLEEALFLDPEYAPALAAAAQTILHLSDHQYSYGSIPLARAEAEAQPLIEMALELDPELAEAHAALGFLHFQRRDFEQAESALVRALEFNPSMSDALNWRALNLNSSGRLREELAVRRRLTEIDPLYLPNMANLASSLSISGGLDEAAALAVLIQRDYPDHSIGYSRHAFVLFSLGRPAGALPLARRALALAPDASYYRSSVSEILFVLGDYAGAQELHAVNGHGQNLFALGRVEEAIAAARGRTAAAPDEPYMAIDQLHTLALAGRYDEVLRLYEQRWGSLAALEAYFSYDFYSNELAPIAAAQAASGRREDLAATLARWNERLEFMREQGYRHPAFTIVQANYEALSGNRSAALARLSEAIGQGHRNPILEHEPAFAGLRGDPAFQVLARHNLDLINVERAKLGLAPLP